MNNRIVLWVLAFLITAASAVYQRLTGPTYPLSGKSEISQETINYKFLRSHGGESDHIVSVEREDEKFSGRLYWKRYKTNDNWTIVEMEFLEGKLSGTLPHQPPAGKLEYYVELYDSLNSVTLPEEQSVVIRFKGDVPPLILILHVFAMFGAMLLSTRTGLEILRKEPKIHKLTYWTIGFMLVGGFILGPIMQKYAFGEYWTGIPFGHDLTDNKTLIAMVAWLLAVFMYRKSKKPVRWALFASLVTLIIFMIPHSVLGSELDYNKLDKEKAEKELLLNKEE